MKKDTPSELDLKPIDMHDTAWPVLKPWTDLLIQPLRKDRGLADSTFALWCRMLGELRGPEPLEAIKAELNVALSLTLPHTTRYQNFYRATTELMTGELKPNNAPTKGLTRSRARRTSGGHRDANRETSKASQPEERQVIIGIKRKRKRKQIVRQRPGHPCCRCSDTGIVFDGSLYVFCDCPLGSDKTDETLKIMHHSTTKRTSS